MGKNGRDLRNLPLLERKAILENVLQDDEFFSKSRFIRGEGIPLFKEIQKAGLEGEIAKRTGPNTPYVSGVRSKQWLKIINYQYENVYLTGYRKDRFGWLAAIEKNGEIQPVGTIEFGPSLTERKAFYQVSQSLIKNEKNNIVEIEPRIQAKVKFRNWTKKHKMRSPVFEEFIM